MAYPKKNTNSKYNSKRLPNNMMKYTSVWSFKTNENAKNQRFISTIKAVLEHDYLLDNVINDNYDDINFWNTVSTYLKVEFFINKKPILLKKLFENFYIKEDFAEFNENLDLIKELNQQCLSTFKFNKNNMIVLNKKDGELAVKENNDRADKICSNSGHNNFSSPNEIIPSEFFKSSAYSLFTEEVNYLSSFFLDNTPNIENGLVSLDTNSNILPTLADISFTIPDWVYQRNSQNTQYSHYYRYNALKSQLELFHSLIFNSKKKKK